jgi:hypothetical protein
MEWQATAVDTSTDSTTVNDDPTLVKGVFVNTTLSNHAVVIKDGSTAKYTIPAQATAGTRYEFGPTMFATSLVVDPDDSSTGNITVEWVNLEPDKR